MKTLWVLLFCLVSTVANAEPLRIYLIYGDWSIVPLAKQIKNLDPQYMVSTHNWERYQEVIDSIRKLPVDKKVVLVGYSFGAHTVTLISNAITDRKIEVGIVYDQSISSHVWVVAPNIKRFFYNNTGTGQASLRNKTWVADLKEKLRPSKK